MATPAFREECCKSVDQAIGEQCVTTAGTVQLGELLVDNWDMVAANWVCSTVKGFTTIICNMHLSLMWQKWQQCTTVPDTLDHGVTLTTTTTHVPVAQPPLPAVVVILSPPLHTVTQMTMLDCGVWQSHLQVYCFTLWDLTFSACGIKKNNYAVSQCTHGSIQLVGQSSREGRLEYCYYGVWSPFCDLYYQTATVACKQLGFTNSPSKCSLVMLTCFYTVPVILDFNNNFVSIDVTFHSKERIMYIAWLQEDVGMALIHKIHIQGGDKHSHITIPTYVAAV